MSPSARKSPKRWTEEEDSILYEEVMKQFDSGSIKDWNLVARSLPKRTNKDCRKRWVNQVCGGLKKGPWKEDEDRRLLDAMSKHGQRWTLVASEVGSRSADQCAKRWQHSLDPKLEHGNWTQEEDERLLKTVKRYGRRWKKIQEKYYATRSRNDLKNRYTILTRKADYTDSICPSPGSSSNGENIDMAQTPCMPTNMEMDNFCENTETTDQSLCQWIFDQDTHSLADVSLETPLPKQDDGGHLAYATSSTSPNTEFTDEFLMPFSPSANPPQSRHSAVTPGAGQMMQNEGMSMDAASTSSFNPFGTVDLGIGVGEGPGALEESMPFHESGLDLSLDCAGLSHLASGSEGASSAGTHRNSLGGGIPVASVSLRVEGCDKETLKYLLDVTQPIKGKVKMEISMQGWN
ncbi:hypothetical protein F5X96DRAFT_192708 [Biscogniauxia mediterranea]|nr:hypothetical protein F5X96DRAFT_192708 [Biscogniauxia mediterranea]